MDLEKIEGLVKIIEDSSLNEFSGDSWSRMDPTFDSNSQDEETIQQYIGDDDNYSVQFTR